MCETIVIKIGGNALAEMNETFFKMLRQLQQQAVQIVIVHGGGPMISKACTEMGLKVIKKSGIRVTDQMTMAVTQQVITETIQPKLLQVLKQQGISAVAMNTQDKMVQGDYLNQSDYGYVGLPAQLPAHTKTYLAQGNVVIFGPLCQTEDQTWLNVNADTMAAFVAKALKADRLVLMTDVPGVLYNGHVMPNVHYQQVQRLIASGILKRGMVPKVAAAYKALEAGVSQVEILGDLSKHGTLVLP
ncbi:acetylglutamate kinase [Agrilactobacillus yilanensis]|uniref:acetylglutamate kinase n=1 Tax=Agrilactobacillus yilanensis TaxID=2485997 RepID=A0ABW4J7N6_9LACO|nr:acetylglutamate kinase [Agrilactobacillus yilanensis]